ncbi:MAG: site-specific integrase, partial [Rhodocyclaceae bacterium]|nr:site-specific integrase [Rhodocyclaceae bacterium]
ARRRRLEARQQTREGVNPGRIRRQQRQARQQAKAQDTVAQVARECFALKHPQWSPTHTERVRRHIEGDLIPCLGPRVLREVEPVELLAVLRRIEARGALETAARTLIVARQIWRYAVSTGRADRDIGADLKEALMPRTPGHFGAITDPVQLGQLLRAIRGYRGGVVVRAALQLAPMLFQRPGELRAARWDEIDLDAALWTIPAARMKRTRYGKENGPPHLVPLPRQAVAILRELRPYTEASGWVFPGGRQADRPMSENALRVALIAMGYTPDVQTWHGFRATARTLLAERLEVDPLLIEAQLAHSVRDTNGRAYNRTTYIEQRRAMMQRWADYLDRLAANAE